MGCGLPIHQDASIHNPLLHTPILEPCQGVPVPTMCFIFHPLQPKPYSPHSALLQAVGLVNPTNPNGSKLSPGPSNIFYLQANSPAPLQRPAEHSILHHVNSLDNRRMRVHDRRDFTNRPDSRPSGKFPRTDFIVLG